MLVTELKNLFQHHLPTKFQINSYNALRNAAFGFAVAINSLVPEGTEKDASILRLREALMLANAGVACADASEDYTEFGDEGCITAYNCHQPLEEEDEAQTALFEDFFGRLEYERMCERERQDATDGPGDKPL